MTDESLGALAAKADNLRNDGKVTAAIAAYSQLAELATQDGEELLAAEAWHMAGVSSKQAALEATGTAFRDAMAFYAKAQSAFEALGATMELGALQRDIAILHDYVGRFSDALPHFQRSIEILSKVDAPAQLAISYDKLGLHFYDQNQLDEAERYMAQALELLRQEPTQGFFQATTYLDLARVLAKKGDLTDAYERASESLSWFEADHGDESYDRRRAQLHGLLAVLCEELGKTKEAAVHAKTYQKLLSGFDPAAAAVVRKDVEATL